MSRSMISGMLDNHGGGGGNVRKRTVWNPNSTLGGAVNVTSSGGGGGGTTFKLSPAELRTFRTIEQDYTLPTANKTYETIPTDFVQYLRLYQLVVRVFNANKSNAGLNVLLQITLDALTGALNSYGLNTTNVELEVQNVFLQGTIEEMLSNQNVQTAYSNNSGTLDMSKTLVLAPLFVYYIQLYGIPEPGTGFDPNKLAIVLNALENSGIDPYN
jgi:hypothetical protein